MTRLTTQAVRDGLRAAAEIRNGKLPSPADLAAAPILTHWALTEDGSGLPRLVGVVRGHPLLGSGWCTTSTVLAMAPDATWARTVSRLYRLDEPLLTPKERR
jgi:hypothetical protein